MQVNTDDGKYWDRIDRRKLPIQRFMLAHTRAISAPFPQIFIFLAPRKSSGTSADNSLSNLCGKNLISLLPRARRGISWSLIQKLSYDKLSNRRSQEAIFFSISISQKKRVVICLYISFCESAAIILCKHHRFSLSLPLLLTVERKFHKDRARSKEIPQRTITEIAFLIRWGYFQYVEGSNVLQHARLSRRERVREERSKD